jgi:hypothetical protein
MTTPDEDIEFLGAVPTASALALAGTTDALIGNYQAQLTDLAEQFNALYDALAKIPPMIRSAYVDNLLVRYNYRRGFNEELIGREIE